MAVSKSKDFWKSKTLWVAVFQGIAGILIAITTEYPAVGGLIISKSAIDVILRILTEKPIK